MLPVMSNLKIKLIAGTVAVALLATSAVPALAWDRGNGHGGGNNNDVIIGTGLGLLLGYGLGSANNQYRQPVYAQPVYPAPVYRPPVYYQPVYPQEPVYQQPVYQQPVYQQPVYPQQSIYNLPVAYAFQNLSWNERRQIQAALTNYGYYHGGLDGNFGPGIYNAISRYARNTGRLQFLGSQAGSAQLFAGLLG